MLGPSSSKRKQKTLAPAKIFKGPAPVKKTPAPAKMLGAGSSKKIRLRFRNTNKSEGANLNFPS